jgi:hypothetical protein
MFLKILGVFPVCDMGSLVYITTKKEVGKRVVIGFPNIL